jgi:hypothetical protein
MPATGTLPTASIYGTWIENVEVWDIVTDMPFELDGMQEITLLLRWPQMGPVQTGLAELALKKSQGQITTPALGVIEWRAELGAMSTLTCGLYEVILLLYDGDVTAPLMIGTVSIVG